MKTPILYLPALRCRQQKVIYYQASLTIPQLRQLFPRQKAKISGPIKPSIEPLVLSCGPDCAYWMSISLRPRPGLEVPEPQLETISETSGILQLDLTQADARCHRGLSRLAKLLQSRRHDLEIPTVFITATAWKQFR